MPKSLRRIAVIVLMAMDLVQVANAQNETEISFSRNIRSSDPVGSTDGIPIHWVRNSTVPGNSDQVHGWRLRMPTSNASVRVREVLTMPGPGTWTHTSSNRTFSISPRRDACLSTWVDYGQNGWIESSWLIQAADPRGSYCFEVFLNDRRVAIIPFEVL